MSSLSQALGLESAINALDGWLLEQDYTARSRDGIAAHIRREGELLGTVPQYIRPRKPRSGDGNLRGVAARRRPGRRVMG
jgi:hypothetical protein